MMDKISFIILIWNSEVYLKKCFDSVILKCEKENIEFEIIAIDNGSKDKSRTILEEYQQNYANCFHYIELPFNMGTTYPRNIGLKKADGNCLCILDSDTEIVEGSIKDILNMLYRDSQIGIIAPKLVLSSGSTQNSVKKFPTFWQKTLKIPKAIFKIKTPDIDFYDEFPFEEVSFVDTAISACWFYRNELHSEVGFLDENIFYSPEDLDFCIRVWKKGFKILYYPDFTVFHDTQQISHKTPFSKNSLSHLKGLFYYFNKHGGWLSNNKLRRHISKKFQS